MCYITKADIVLNSWLTSLVMFHTFFCLINWGWWKHWLHLCRRVRPPPPTNECLGYDIKQSDAEVPVMMELWRMGSTSSLPLLLGPLWPGVIASDKVLSTGQIELNCILMLNWTAWNRTVLTCKLHTYAKLNYLK